MNEISDFWLTLSLGLISIVAISRLMRSEIKHYQYVKKGESFAKLIYTDEKGGKLLRAPQYGIQGKPDYIFQKWFTRRLVPFEIKSGVCKEGFPHEGDLMQLVAYFLIIEEVYDKRPHYGRLVYSNTTFKVRNTRHLRNQLKRTVKAMQIMYEKGGLCKVDAEPSYLKCKNCICQQTVCEWYTKKETGL